MVQANMIAAEMTETSGAADLHRSRELTRDEVRQAVRYGHDHHLKSVPVQFRESGKPITRDDHTDLVTVIVSVPGAGF